MKRIAVFFVGNRLMLDDGVGPAAYDLIREEYILPDNVDMFDVGCMSLDMISKVNEYDFMITVDAVDESARSLVRYFAIGRTILREPAVPAPLCMTRSLPICLMRQHCLDTPAKACATVCRF